MAANHDQTGSRLGGAAGLLIDRTRPVAFRFAGRTVIGFAGDTIASALAAEGQWLLSRSFKYHRPRGVLSMAGWEANTLVQLLDEPNVLADRYPIRDGLDVRPQNVRGSLERDRGAALERFGRFMPIGFYYKAFYRPAGAWKFWEPIIRRRAGLGRVNAQAAHGYFDKAYDFCDVAVIGGGPAGIMAALEAARAGAEVVLIDENPVLGGSLAYARFGADSDTASRRRAALADEVRNAPRLRVLTDATCQGWFTDNWLPVIRGNRMIKLRARVAVIATGSYEQPMVFRNNDLPGVMLGSAAQRLIRLYAVRPGRRAVVATANDDGYQVALDLADANIAVAAVADLRPAPAETPSMAAARARQIPILAGHGVAEAVRSGHHLGGAMLGPIDADGAVQVRTELACDLLCMSAGYAPAAALLWQAGGTLAYDDKSAMHQLDRLPACVLAAGSVAGAYALDAVLADGRRAGRDAARSLGFVAVGPEPEQPADRGAAGVSHPWPIFRHPKGKEFVDFDEDLQIRDILDAVAEGYDDVQLLKRYSTLGMGPSQGRHSSVNAIRLCARATGRSPDQVGTTTSRPPYGPEKLGHLAGRSFDPVRRSAMHHRHLELGAQMMPAGAWLRPAYYGVEAGRDAAIAAEVLAVRQGVGLIDVSTLGGFDIRGPDAAAFMERIYTWNYAKQPVGRARYVLMCDEAGAIIDDGVACRLHAEHFYATATTGGAERAFQLMQWWNAQWRLRVDIANVTAAFCGVNLAGPKSRNVLARLCADIDLSPAAMPYMAVAQGTVAGIPVRVLRVGFVGELGYELHAPAGHGEALWDALMTAGRDLGIRAFGVEAQRVLRLEKGHIIVGQDTDGLTHPYEAQMDWAVGKKKPFFVGKRAIEIHCARGLRRRLVGFTIPDPFAPLPEECHLVVRAGEIVGRVTSVARSPALERPIGLAFVAPDQAEIGSGFDIKLSDGRWVRAEVVPVPFYDPANQRQEL